MEVSERSLTIRIKICHLISSLMQHNMDLNFRAEVQFRNQVAEYLAMWMRGGVVISESPSHEESLQKLVCFLGGSAVVCVCSQKDMSNSL